MQNKLFAIVITALLVLMMSGSAMCATYDSNVTLENKNSSWDVIEDDISAVVDYNASGDVFAWRAYGNVPNFEIGTAKCYALIYYADKDDRFVNWGGDNPGALLGVFEVNACDGSFDSGDMETPLDINMPEVPDYNIDPDPWNEYCDEETDNFEQCCGAKLWIVPCDDYDEPAMTAWNPGDYLFETNFIWYDNTDHDLSPIIETTWATWDDPYQAGDTMEITARVRDNDGVGDLDNMSVIINLTEYGVEGVTTLELDEVINCVSANYTASVEMTVATDGKVSEDVIATDQTGLNGSLAIWFYVEPRDCAYLEIRDYYTGDEPETKALTKEYYCYDYEHNWYWDDQYELYHNRYSVYGYDIYSNCIGPIGGHECCDSFIATVDSPASLEYYGGQYYWWNHNYISVYNDGYPADVVLRAHCVDNGDVESAELTISFLQSVSYLDVESDIPFVYVGECYNITAQIMDIYDEPIHMPGVDVDMYVNSEYIGNADTDNNGTVTFVDVCYDVGYVGTISIRAVAECREGSLGLDVIDDVLDYVEIGAESPVEFGDEQPLTCTCYTNHSTEMCCDDGVWSCNEFGDVNETGYFTAGDTEGVAVVEVNVSGVIGTVDIVINGIDCDGYAAYPVPGVEGNMTSGTVSVSWNFTGNGTVCIQALGDPIPEWINDTKGASVSVDTHDEGGDETVMLDLNGTGDTWILNDTTWEFYATGDTSEVGLGIYQMFALVYDEPEPEPDPEPTPTATRGRSSGGGGGLYVYDSGDTGSSDDGAYNETDGDSSGDGTAVETPIPEETQTPVETPTPEETPVEEETDDDGGISWMWLLIVLSVVAVIVGAYLLTRNSDTGTTK